MFLSKLRWRIQIPIENILAWCINTYDVRPVRPYGNCPVQAEGYLPTGAYYYFRSRYTTWSLRIGKNINEVWEDSAWVYTENKYKEHDGGWISNLEVVRNFNKAMKLYLRDNGI